MEKVGKHKLVTNLAGHRLGETRFLDKKTNAIPIAKVLTRQVERSIRYDHSLFNTYLCTRVGRKREVTRKSIPPPGQLKPRPCGHHPYITKSTQRRLVTILIKFLIRAFRDDLMILCLCHKHSTYSVSLVLTS